MSKVYAVADLHGNYSAWLAIKEKLNIDDTLYILGDCIDRGADGLQIVDEVLADPRCIYLKGNHEDMAAAALKQQILMLESDDYVNGFAEFSLSTWFENGGNKTYENMKDLKDYKKYYKIFNSLPERIDYISKYNKTIILTHAGFTPSIVDGDIVQCFSERHENYLWNRLHLLEDYNKWYKDEDLEDVYVVFGHTPVICKEVRWVFNQQGINLETWKAVEVARWDQGHKIDIDIAAIWSNKVAMLNLDTLEVEYVFGVDTQYMIKE